MTKQELAELIRTIRDGADAEVESALFAMCDDLGAIEMLCKLTPESFIAELEANGKDVLW